MKPFYHALVVQALFICTAPLVLSQAPANDNCSNASLINVGDAGYDLGIFVSSSSDVTQASRENAETCSDQLTDYGNCGKTVWYRFYIATTRNVSVSLMQNDSVIPEIYAGFDIYYNEDCNYTSGNLSNNIAPMNKFGISGNSCLASGWYLIQVGAKQKTIGELWIELNVSKPASDTFDHLEHPYVIRDRGSQSYHGCNSLEKFEIDPSVPSAFNQSIWAMAIIQAGYNSYLVELESECYYKIFNEKPSPTAIASIPYSFCLGRGYPAEIYTFLDHCHQSSTPDTIYLLILTRSENESIRYNVDYETNDQLTSAPWNNSSTPDIIDQNVNPYFSRSRGFTCTDSLKYSRCDAIPEYYTYVSGNDTLQYHHAGYQVLKVAEDGRLALTFEDFVLVTIYEGDISKSCNLTLWKQVLLERHQFNQPTYLCISKGVYTAVYTSNSPNISDRLSVSLAKQNAGNSKHTNPMEPEFLGRFDPNTSRITSDTLVFPTKETTVVIDGVPISGRLSFKEVYYSASGSSSIISRYGYIYLFRGSVSMGTATKIPDLDYTRASEYFGYSSWYYFGDPRCFVLEEGYYSIVCVIPYISYLSCWDYYFHVELIGHPPCPIINTEPQTAIPLNNNNNIIDIATKVDDNYYQVRLTGCSDCVTRSKHQPNKSCSSYFLDSNRIFRYYTFRLTRPMSLNLDNNRHYLFVGNCLRDPALILDSTNRISKCNEGTYCNLLPNIVYTLILEDYPKLEFYDRWTLNFSEVFPTPNDFISQSMDFGHVGGAHNLLSEEVKVSCHTNGLIHELPFQSYHRYPVPKAPVQFPDTPNTSSNRPYQTAWFTFTLDELTKLRIDIIDSSSRSSHYLDFFLYEYLGDYNESFNQVLLRGFDSSLAQFKEITTLFYNAGFVSELVNQPCEPKRYFLCARFERQVTSRSFKLKLLSEPMAYNHDGDLCREPKSLKIRDYGTYNTSTYNLCHTYGKSPFEDNALIADLAKSTWFEIDIDSLREFDLSVEATFKTYNSGFVLYAGTCGALTKITSTGNNSAYFTLTCMGSGKYYIQFLSWTNRYMVDPKELSFRIIITPKKNSACKPYDFKKPLSHFEFTGGCHVEDTIRLTNFSTRGDDMEYKWLLNNRLFCTQPNTVISRHHPWIQNENKFTLVALNAVTGLADTSVQIYFRDTTAYSFNLLGVDSAFCFDTTKFYPITNFPNKLNYEWYDGPFNRSYYNILTYEDTLIRFANHENRIYHLYAQSENCNFHDSISILYLKPFHRYFDTTLCEDESIILTYDGGVRQLNNSSLSSSYDRTINEPGVYAINYVESRYCYYDDTIKVDYDYGPRMLTIHDTIYECNTPSTRLIYDEEQLSDFNWSTGDTTREIWVDTNGLFRLTGDFTRCRSLDYTAIVSREVIDTNQLLDSLVCRFDSVILRNPYPSSFKVMHRVPIADKVLLTNNVLFTLDLGRSRCRFRDEALYKLFPPEGGLLDSLHCDTTESMLLVLDGGEAINYDWYQHGGNSRYLPIEDYGYYPVALLTYNNCRDTLEYNIQNSCVFRVWLPTIFSPNEDQLNDVFKPHIRSAFKNYELAIYNRWGNLIFRSDQQGGWDGRYAGEVVSAGVYAFTLAVILDSGARHYFTGVVKVLR